MICIVACGTEHATVERHRPRYVPVYDESSCLVPKFQGAQALNFDAAAKNPIRLSPFFKKKFSPLMLEAVLGASSYSTGQYVNSLLGGRAFRIPRDEVPNQKVCPMFTDLPEAPDSLRNIWDAMAVDTGDPIARLAGLYFENCVRLLSCDDHQVIAPTILIDEARDRWTLVHEMMHYNFDVERKRDMDLIGDVTLEAQGAAIKATTISEYQTYSANRDRETLESLAQHASWLTRVFYQETLLRSSLEEIAVEGTLLDEYIAGRLKNVADESARSSLWYMAYSLDRASQAYDETVFKAPSPLMSHSLISLLGFISNEAGDHGWNDIATHANEDLEFIRSNLRKAGEQIEDLRGRYLHRGSTPLPIKAPNAELSASEAVASHLNHLPGSQIFDRLKNL